MALFHSGQSQAAIGRALGMGRKTIRRWLRRGEFPERKPPHRPPPKVSEFADYLQQRWNEGCHNASRLYQEIRQKGYSGKHAMVRRFLSGWRKTGKPTSPEAPQRISPKHAAILVTRPADKINDEQQQLLDRIAMQCPEVRHPPRSGWLDELGRLKDGRSLGLGVARCAPYWVVQN
jgi:transposase